MASKAAILGGTPIFSEALPFAKPTLPSFEEVEDELKEIFKSGMVTKGKFLQSFEEELCNYLKVPYALGVSNGTAGLYMLIKALDLRGEVIVPSFSFMSTFHVVEQAGLTPVFVDCELDTFTIDIKKIKEAITPKTSAVMAVTIFGNPPDMDYLERLTKDKHIKFIMDSAHSFGTLYKNNLLGNYGDGEVFSTSATKLLATGEGGVITTKDKSVAKFLREYREYGNKGDYDCAVPGINGRMSEIHALIGLKILPKLEKYAVARNNIAKSYINNLKDIPGIVFQKIRPNCRSSYKDFGILIKEESFGLNREQIREALQFEGIGTRAYFYPPGHRQTYYKNKYPNKYSRGLKNTNYISEHSLMLPIYSHMKKEQVDKVCEAISRIYNSREEIFKISLCKV